MTDPAQAPDPIQAGVLLVVTLVAVTVLAGVFLWALLRAGALPHPVSLVVALAMLSLTALVGYAITKAAELATIGAAGVGALAGAVTSTYRGPPPPPSDPPDDRPDG